MRYNFQQRIGLGLKLLMLLVLVGMYFGLIGQIIQAQTAYTQAQFKQECLSRNIQYGCECNCSQDYNPDEDTVSLRMCTSGSETESKCEGTSIFTFANYNTNDSDQTVVPTQAGQKSNNTTSQFNFFPQTGPAGILVVDESTGTVQLDATVANIMRWVFYLLGAIAFVIVFVGGFMVITAGSNEERSQNGTVMIRNAIIGIVISIFGIILVGVISAALGIDANEINFNDNLQEIQNEPERPEDDITFDDIE